MGEGVDKQGLSSQDDECAEESVRKADQRTGKEGPLHERVAEWLNHNREEM